MSSLLTLPPHVLAEITRLLDPSSLLNLVKFSGNKRIFRECVAAEGAPELVMMNKDEVSFFVRNCLHFLPMPHLTHLLIGNTNSDDLVLPVSPMWTLSLPPTMISIKMFCERALVVWLRPIKEAQDDDFIKHVASCYGAPLSQLTTTESMKDRFPNLQTLHLGDGCGVEPFHDYSNPMLQRFVQQLPATLTSLLLTSNASYLTVPAPPLAVLQNLDELTMEDSSPLEAIFPASLEEETRISSFVSALANLGYLEFTRICNAPLTTLLPHLPSIHTLKGIVIDPNLVLPTSLTSLQCKYAGQTSLNKILCPLTKLSSLSIWFPADCPPVHMDYFPPTVKFLALSGMEQVDLTLAPGILPPSLTEFFMRGLNVDLASIDWSKAPLLYDLYLKVAKCDFEKIPPSVKRLTTFEATPSDLRKLPTTVQFIKTCISIEQDDLADFVSIKSWKCEDLVKHAAKTYLPHLRVENLEGTVDFSEAKVSADAVHWPMTDYEESQDSTIFLFGGDIDQIPSQLTRLVLKTSIGSFITNLPSTLKELQLGGHLSLNGSVNPIKAKDFASPEGKKIMTSLPPLLHTLKVGYIQGVEISAPSAAKNRSKYAAPIVGSDDEDIPPLVDEDGDFEDDSDGRIFWPILFTAPLLRTLALTNLESSLLETLNHLPPTITDLTVAFPNTKHEKNVPTASFPPPNLWLPFLRRFTFSGLLLNMECLMPRIKELEYMQVSKLLITGELMPKFPEQVDSLDAFSLRRHCLQLLPPPLRHVKNAFLYEWNAQSMKALPKTLTNIAWTDLDNTHRFSITDNELIKSLPQHLLRLHFNNYRVFPNLVLEELPSTLTVLVVARVREPTIDQLLSLPPGLTDLQIEDTRLDWTVEMLSALPVSIIRLTIPNSTLMTHMGLPEKLKFLMAERIARPQIAMPDIPATIASIHLIGVDPETDVDVRTNKIYSTDVFKPQDIRPGKGLLLINQLLVELP